jgi:LPPG:FO 2-phospho-L-lactate transferase
MQELGIEANSLSIAQHYSGLIDAIVLDTRDADTATCAALRATGIATAVTDTLMRSVEDRRRVAGVALELAASIAPTLMALRSQGDTTVARRVS